MARLNTSSTSEWNISTDIYGIVDQIDALKAKYIDDESETTLALGIFGFLGDTEAKKIQSSIIMTGELGNEMFPNRAKLSKNILAHAIYSNIEGINATPSHITAIIGVREVDLNKYMLLDENTEMETFVFNQSDGIYLDDGDGTSIEFHLDYDLHLRRVLRTENGNTQYVYNAIYNIEETNPISDIVNAYIGQPYVQIFNNYSYIFFQVVLHQVTITEINDNLISDSIIDNKSYTFTFENQLAAFDVYVTDNGVETKLTPLFYGSSVEEDVERYCWYLYINDNTVRIGFDPSSYIPGLNSSIRIVVYTTLGDDGNFEYADTDSSGIYSTFLTPTNRKINCYVRPTTDATDGIDRKDSDELKGLIPKMALSRGYITTETDLNNYFNFISNEDNRLKLQKKVDNQLSRIWYSYFLLKDLNGDVIPTNTIRVKIDPFADYIRLDESEEKRYIVPAGTLFRYSVNVGYGEVVSTTPFPYQGSYFDESSDYFYYRTPYNIVINDDPLYSAFYLTTVYHDSFFEYNFVNSDCILGFTTISNHIERSLLREPDLIPETDDGSIYYKRFRYQVTFSVAQSITDSTTSGDTSFGLIEKGDDDLLVKTGEYDEDGDAIVDTTNLFIKCFLVIHMNNEPYRYAECIPIDIADTSDPYNTIKWKCNLYTDDGFDTKNRIKLLSDTLYEAGTGDSNYGYFENNCEAYLYICAKFDNQYIDINNTLSKVIPSASQDGYTLVNIYKVHDGFTFFNNFTSVMNSKVRKNMSEDEDSYNYDVYGVPLVGEHYFYNSKCTTYADSLGNYTAIGDFDEAEERVEHLITEMAEKKAYIDYCLKLIENNMDIDFKFFNTYGPSETYTVGYSTSEFLDHVDLTLNFKIKLIDSSDTTTKDSLIDYIKDYVENINDLGSLHFPNLIRDVLNDYDEAIEYIDFRYYNEKNLGVNHIQLQDPDESTIVPEFLCIRNKLADDGVSLIPCINIDIVMD